MGLLFGPAGATARKPKTVECFFDSMLEGYPQGPDPCLFLPSVLELSKMLSASPLEIHCALLELRRQGYDYFTLGLHSPVTLWHPSRMVLE